VASSAMSQHLGCRMHALDIAITRNMKTRINQYSVKTPERERSFLTKTGRLSLGASEPSFVFPEAAPIQDTNS
jgi:hypothetical protein